MQGTSMHNLQWDNMVHTNTSHTAHIEELDDNL